jgi:carboxyl-terminal processing protease
MKRISISATVGAAMLFAAAAPAWSASSETYRQLNLFGDVFERIRSDYVEEVGDPDLVEAAINGMLRSLDPHSSYLNPKTYRDMQVQTRGEFGGLGIEVTLENGVVKVVSPIDDTPASRAGLKTGDYITHLNGEPVLGMTLSEAVEKMRGPVNSTVRLTISRPGEEAPFDVDIQRDVVRIQSVRSRAEDDVAYVRITSFNEQTDRGLSLAMERLRTEIGDRFKGVVLDLRNNPGGLLEQAVAVSDAFLDKGEIVSTRGRKPEDTQRFNAQEGDLAGGKPVIVLINGGSASASEIVAGALQDHKRAVVLGTRSFGKGSVQTIIPLQGHGAIRLTTARYYTPSGRSIQAKGIQPDIDLPQSKVESLENGKRPSEADLPQHLDAEKSGGDAKKSEPSEAGNPRVDFQLSYALDLLRGLAILDKPKAN